MSSLTTSVFRRRPRAASAGAALLATCLVTAAALAEPAQPQTESLAHVRSAAEALLRSELHDVSYGIHLAASQLDPRLHLAYCPAPLAAARAAGAAQTAKQTASSART